MRQVCTYKLVNFPRIYLPTDFVKLLSDPSSDLCSVNPIPSTEDFVDFLRKRSLDDSVYVRKNALQVHLFLLSKARPLNTLVNLPPPKKNVGNFDLKEHHYKH
jgi:hypothetical protein